MKLNEAMLEIYGPGWRENLDDILGEIMSDCASPAYCKNPGCFYYEDSLEPDAHGCTCDDCGTDTVQSVAFGFGLI